MTKEEVVYVCYTHWEEGTTIRKVFRHKEQAEEWVEKTKPRLRKMGDLYHEYVYGARDFVGSSGIVYSNRIKLTEEERYQSHREAEEIQKEYGYGAQDCWASFDEVEIE